MKQKKILVRALIYDTLILELPQYLIPTGTVAYQFSSVHFSHSVMSDSLWSHGLQYAQLLCPSPTLKACSNSCPSSWWCHPTVSSYVVHFSSSLQSFPASGFFLMSQFFTSSGQRVRASASVFSVDIQDWFPFGLTGLFMSKCLINYRLYF